MKKILLVIFILVLCVCNVKAQAQLGGFFFVCEQFIQNEDSIIDNNLSNPLDINNKTNQIFISKNRYPNYNALAKVRMFFSLQDVNAQPITSFPANRFKVRLTVTGKAPEEFFLTSNTRIYDFLGIIIKLSGNTIKATVTDMNYAITYPAQAPYTNTGFPILQKIIIYNPYQESKYICKGGSFVKLYDNMDLETSIYRDGQQNLKFQWTASTGGAFTDISGATNASINVSNVTVKTYYNRKAIFTTSSGVTTTYFSKDTLLILTPMDCGVFSSEITGASVVSPKQTVTYSIPATVGMEYFWVVTGGTIISGQGTNSIEVLWDTELAANARTSISDYAVSVTETDASPQSKTTSLPVTMLTTNINNSFGTTGISLFPNPSKEEFKIVMPHSNTDVSYTLYTTTGINIQSGMFTSASSGNTIATNLSAGMYQLVLNYDGVFTSTRLAVVE